MTCDADDRFSNPVEARKKAMDYLARRDYGHTELQMKLQRAGFEADTAKPVVDQLAREGLQNDKRFVESFMRSRVSQGKGPVRIRLELRQHGIDEALVDESLDASLDVSEENWSDLAAAVRARKFGKELPRDFREKARQMRFLQYRGFESAHIQRAVGGTDEE
ncbi:MAG: regulatory protein RecX [Woeseia sp.]